MRYRARGDVAEGARTPMALSYGAKLAVRHMLVSDVSYRSQLADISRPPGNSAIIRSARSVVGVGCGSAYGGYHDP